MTPKLPPTTPPTAARSSFLRSNVMPPYDHKLDSGPVTPLVVGAFAVPTDQGRHDQVVSHAPKAIPTVSPINKAIPSAGLASAASRRCQGSRRAFPGKPLRRR